MLLTPVVLAASRKIKDDRAKKKEAKQGHLSVGDSEVARAAFSSQTNLIDKPPSRGLPTRDTVVSETPYETPADFARSDSNAGTQSDSVSGAGLPSLRTNYFSPQNASSPVPETQDAGHAHIPAVRMTSPVMSESGSLAVVSPGATEGNRSAFGSRSTKSGSLPLPPPYSPLESSSSAGLAPSDYERSGSSIHPDDFDSQSSISSDPTVHSIPGGGHAVRIRSNGADIRSGFAYNPALYDLRIRPDQWEDFTYQIIQSAKFGAGDNAQMWAAATATALTGAIATSVWVGRSIRRTIQEKKIKAGLAGTADGGMGEVLKHWNHTLFHDLGLFVHFELSESAMKNPDQKTKFLRKSALLYSTREERDRKREERKFCIVITKLSNDGVPEDAMHELAAEAQIVEAEGGDGDNAMFKMAELPGEDGGGFLVELPGDSVPFKSVSDRKMSGYAELSDDATPFKSADDRKMSGYAELPSDVPPSAAWEHPQDEKYPMEDPEKEFVPGDFGQRNFSFSVRQKEELSTLKHQQTH